MKVVRIRCMGDSYAENSLYQNYNFHAFVKPHLSHALDHFAHRFFLPYARDDISAPTHFMPDSSHDHTHTLGENPHDAQHRDTRAGLENHDENHHLASVVRLTVADFGCSHGRNTLDYAAFIMHGVYNRLKGKLAPPAEVEMQYSFSDLPGNNFNALLQSLEPFLQEQLQSLDDRAAPLKLKVFTAAVAGSFHGRLFPSDSLHLAISAFSLLWLSQVPPEVVDRDSPAWNGGHIWIHGTRPKVVEAYALQFQKDIKSFLFNRAKEIASGGILFLFFPCRAEKYPQGAFFTPHHDIWSGCYESSWEVMVQEGLITKEERDMFNIPFYNCHKTEMQEALDEFSNKFKLVKLDVLKDCNNLPKEEDQKIKTDSQAFGNFVSKLVASLMKPMLQDYLGESRADMLLQRICSEATKKAYLSTSISYDMLLVILEKL